MTTKIDGIIEDEKELFSLFKKYGGEIEVAVTNNQNVKIYFLYRESLDF
jgi:hypothetical protein